MKLYVPTSLNPRHVIESINCLRNFQRVYKFTRGYMTARALNNLANEYRECLVRHYIHRESLAAIFGESPEAQASGREIIEDVLAIFIGYLDRVSMFFQPLPIKESPSCLPPELAQFHRQPRRLEFNGRRPKMPRTSDEARRIFGVSQDADEDTIFEALLVKVESVNPDYYQHGCVEAFAATEEWLEAFYAAWKILVPAISLDLPVRRVRRLSEPRSR